MHQLSLGSFLEAMKYTPGEEKTIYRQKYKAKKLIKENCIIKASDVQWIIKPIKEYNKTTYKVEYLNGFTCNCQYFATTGKECSHIKAVRHTLERD